MEPIKRKNDEDADQGKGNTTKKQKSNTASKSKPNQPSKPNQSNSMQQQNDNQTSKPNSIKHGTSNPSKPTKRLPSNLKASTANVSSPSTNVLATLNVTKNNTPMVTNSPKALSSTVSTITISSTITASTANTVPKDVNQPKGIASNSKSNGRIQIKDEETNRKVVNLAASEKYRLKRHGLIRISLHGTNIYTEPELRHILTRFHTKSAQHMGNNLIVATAKVGNLTTVDQNDTRTISELDEFGPELDQSTQVNGEEIDDMITTCDMSQWQEQVDIPVLVENPEIIISTIKPKEINFNQKAFTNYTKHAIPEDIGVILSMGPKFAAPVYYKNEDYKELKEAAFMLNEAYCHIDDKKTVRLNLIQQIQNYQEKQLIEHSSTIRNYFNEALKHTKQFIKNHPNVIITQADKARATILMEKTTYINKVENLLRDRSTYAPLKKSSIAAYMKMNEGLLVRLEKAQWTTREKVEEAIENENHAANLYALIKTHKQNAPPRPIVNTRNSPGYLAATIVTQNLSKARDTKKYNVLNSRKACEKIRDLTVAPDEKFYSFDIISMFTNIPVERTIEAVKKRQSKLGLDNEQLSLIIDVIKFVCLTSTEIMFNDKIYKQIRGLRMGSSLSPILADFVVEDMLDSAFKTIERPLLLIKYVDDIMAVIEEEKANDMLTALNKMDPHIKFEMEKEVDHRINYLDVTIINDGWKPKTKWYQKHISSGTFLNFHSHHSKSNIWNTAVQYVVTMICNSHSDYFEEVLHTAMNRLLRNSYPSNYAKKVIEAAQEKIVLKMLTNQEPPNTQTTSNQTTTEEESFYCESLNYIPKLTENLKRIIEESAKKNEENIQIPLKPIYKMSKQIYNKQKNSNQSKGTKQPSDIEITIDEDDIDLTQPLIVAPKPHVEPNHI